MEPKIIKSKDFIEVIGHYDNEIQCAKMTLLANLYAIEHKDGYAKFPLSVEDKLKAINDKLEFIPPSLYVHGLGLNAHTYLWLNDEYTGDDIGMLPTTELGSRLYPTNGDVLTLSSSSTSKIPITDYKITNVVARVDYTEYSFTNNTITVVSGSYEDSITITVEPVSSDISLDLSTIGLPEGTHSIQMKLSDDGVTKADSDLSNSVTYVQPSGETWVINEIPVISSGATYNINFNSNNATWQGIILATNGDMNYIAMSGRPTQIYTGPTSGPKSWIDQAYRTVTFETTPTGDLLTWLQANAVKQ